MTAVVSREMRKKLMEAFIRWDAEMTRVQGSAYNVGQMKPATDTGIDCLRYFAPLGIVGVDIFVKLAMRYHDMRSTWAWEEAVNSLALKLGPSDDFVTLAGWHYMAYDGWKLHIQVHRIAPVNTREYVLAMLASSDMKTTIMNKEF